MDPRSAPRGLQCLFMAALLLVPGAALAAGGAHVIDDSEVEAAGDCHLETWVMGSSDDRWLGNAGAGCTPEAIPVLEFGASVVHARSRGSEETVVGVMPKLNLRPANSGLGVALAGSLVYGADRSRLEAASLIAAATVPASKSLRFHLNAGWVWSNPGPGSELFAGAQAEWQVSPGIGLMAEGFTRDHGKAGAHAGVRWTSGDGRIDVDLTAGRYVDESTPTSIAVGLTIRE